MEQSRKSEEGEVFHVEPRRQSNASASGSSRVSLPETAQQWESTPQYGRAQFAYGRAVEGRGGGELEFESHPTSRRADHSVYDPHVFGLQDRQDGEVTQIKKRFEGTTPPKRRPTRMAAATTTLRPSGRRWMAWTKSKSPREKRTTQSPRKKRTTRSPLPKKLLWMPLIPGAQAWSHGIGLIITSQKSLKSYRLFEIRKITCTTTMSFR